MELLVSKLTQSYRVTIPEFICRCLAPKVGDSIRFRADGGKAFIDKLLMIEDEFAAAVGKTLSEWSSVADDTAYKRL